MLFHYALLYVGCRAKAIIESYPIHTFSYNELSDPYYSPRKVTNEMKNNVDIKVISYWNYFHCCIPPTHNTQNEHIIILISFLWSYIYLHVYDVVTNEIYIYLSYYILPRKVENINDFSFSFLNPSFLSFLSHAGGLGHLGCHQTRVPGLVPGVRTGRIQHRRPIGPRDPGWP